jgi:DNA-directed RNA polymerase subunit M/transcription elongation factor TFIIS
MQKKGLENYCKYTDFVTEQSKDISYSLAISVQKMVSRQETILNLDKYINDMKLSMEVEAGIFEYSLLYIISNNYSKTQYKRVYDYKVNEIIGNIKRNHDLISELHSNIKKPRFLAFMTPSQLCPKIWEELLEKKHMKEEKENNLPTTDIYRCRKCEQRKCTVSFLQTRSIDEPMTIFVRCCNCYNTWTV